MPQFETVELDLAPSSQDDQSVRLAGPSVICIGWIPYLDDILQLPPGGFQTVAQSRSRPKALNPESHLFKSGNPRPASIRSPDALANLISEREFRSVVGLTSVFLTQTRKGRFTRCEFEKTTAVGFTRMPLGPKWCGGYGAGDHEVVLNDAGLTIRLWYRFKMGRLAELGNLLLTAKWAPSAVILVEYSISFERNVVCRMTSSAVPSQELVVDWASGVTCYDMLTAVAEHVRGFFNAGGCQDAPLQYDQSFDLGHARLIS